MSKYQDWYRHLMDAAQSREHPRCYTEIHHIVPRSLGGCDSASNLVRLTYREHFIAHWLLAKFTIGADRRKMQRAMAAMTLQVDGRRTIAGWQFEAAKRAIRDLELDPEIERAWHERWNASRANYVPGGWLKKRDRAKRPSQLQRLKIKAERCFAR